MEIIMSEATGQKHTRTGKHVFEDGDWWYYYPEDGSSIHTGGHIRERTSVKEKRNSNRMWVDGNYISQAHPLHKPGRYKGFTDAAFSSLENYERSKEGEVYIMCNPSFPGWVKVGMAVDSKDRLKQYQTSSPYRDYEIVKSYKVSDRREAESKAHNALTLEGRGRKGEWFYMGSTVAVDELDKLFYEGGQFELF